MVFYISIQGSREGHSSGAPVAPPYLLQRFEAGSKAGAQQDSQYPAESLGSCFMEESWNMWSWKNS